MFPKVLAIGWANPRKAPHRTLLNPANNNYGGVTFAGSQTLGGNGEVVFGARSFWSYPYDYNAPLLAYDGTTGVTLTRAGITNIAVS